MGEHLSFMMWLPFIGVLFDRRGFPSAAGILKMYHAWRSFVQLTFACARLLAEIRAFFGGDRVGVRRLVNSSCRGHEAQIQAEACGNHHALVLSCSLFADRLRHHMRPSPSGLPPLISGQMASHWQIFQHLRRFFCVGDITDPDWPQGCQRSRWQSPPE